MIIKKKSRINYHAYLVLSMHSISQFVMIKIFKDELFSQIKEVKPKKIVPNKYYYYVPNEIKKKPQKKKRKLLWKQTKNNIFSGLFQISFNDKFGTINECKFCDPYISSNYDGINAGWGYIVLLTKLLSVKYGFESAKYILIPEGNFSKIKNKNGTLHEIRLSDINRTKDKFNNAMCAYLEYLKEFLDYLTKENKIDITKKNLCPNINGNLINDKSILIESKDNLENWYQAMKFVLTILKFLICQILSNENEFYKQIITK